MGDLTRIELPAWALEVMDGLEAAGYAAYAVGGAVRDTLMGRPISDVDVATSATPAQTTACLEAVGMKVHQTGAAHGTVTAMSAGHPVEVTTFRVDGSYSDARHPDSVRRASSIEEDLARRDFTVNAIAYNPASGIVDPYGGREDIGRGLIRCVGEPARRFAEDALRIMRALRFSAQLGFEIEGATSEALVAARAQLGRISDERIGKEFCGIVQSPSPGRVLGAYAEVIAEVIPQILPTIGLQTGASHHVYDVWTHTLVALDAQESDDLATRMATFFHDLGKPVVDDPARGEFRFEGHAEASAEICRETLRRFAVPGKVVEEASAIIAAHDHRFDPTDESVRRWMGRLGVDVFFKTLDLKRADIRAHAPELVPMVERIDRIEECARRALEAGECFTVAGLAVSGRDLIAAGHERGPGIGEKLEWLLEQVITGACPNEREALLAALRER